MVLTFSKKAGNSLLLMLTLFAASISACACAHHQPQAEAAENSCHGTQHSAASHNKKQTVDKSKSAKSHSHGKAVSDNEDRAIAENAFATLCDCYVRQPVPAIAAKTENKKQRSETAPVELPAIQDNIQIVFASSYISEVGIDAINVFYKGRSGRSMPARAPPRL